jgi:hypothetical protein
VLATLEQDRPPAGGGQEAPAERDEAAQAGERAILCAACGHLVTTARQRSRVNGAHEHRFMNLEGSTFHIGCFGEAMGCTVRGPPSPEYAWFPGFTWRFAHCGGCQLQLGWHFAALEATPFFGLILDRLREAGLDEPGA